MSNYGPNFFGKPPPSTGKFTVVAHVVAKGTAEADVIRPILLDIEKNANSDAEPDCTLYKVSQADDDPNTFNIYEEYNSAAAFKHHCEQAVFQKLAQNVDKAEIGHLRFFRKSE